MVFKEKMKSKYPLTFKSILFYWVLFIIIGINATNTSTEFVGLFYVTIVVMSYLLIKDQGKLEWGAGIWYGLGLGTAVILDIFIIEYAAGFIAINGTSGIAVKVLLVALLFQVLVSFGEEMAFRGYILQNMNAEMSTSWAVFYSSVLFSVIHLPAMVYYKIDPLHIGIMAVTLLLFSVLASQLYLRFGLLSAIGVHFSWNVMQYHIMSMQSRSIGLLDVEYLSGEWLTGGNLGPEAGLLGILVLAVCVVLVNRLMFNSSNN